MSNDLFNDSYNTFSHNSPLSSSLCPSNIFHPTNPINPANPTSPLNPFHPNNPPNPNNPDYRLTSNDRWYHYIAALAFPFVVKFLLEWLV